MTMHPLLACLPKLPSVSKVWEVDRSAAGVATAATEAAGAEAIAGAATNRIRQSIMNNYMFFICTMYRQQQSVYLTLRFVMLFHSQIKCYKQRVHSVRKSTIFSDFSFRTKTQNMSIKNHVEANKAWIFAPKLKKNRNSNIWRENSNFIRFKVNFKSQILDFGAKNWNWRKSADFPNVVESNREVEWDSSWYFPAMLFMIFIENTWFDLTVQLSHF